MLRKITSFYRSLILSRELSDIDRRAAMGAFLPTASASFSYALGGMGNGGSFLGAADFSSAQLGLTVTIPLFVGAWIETALSGGWTPSIPRRTPCGCVD